MKKEHQRKSPNSSVNSDIWCHLKNFRKLLIRNGQGEVVILIVPISKFLIICLPQTPGKRCERAEKKNIPMIEIRHYDTKEKSESHYHKNQIILGLFFLTEIFEYRQMPMS